MHTIRQAAAETGISESTLRAWERRYGLGSTARSDGGYRLYDEAALVTLRRVKALVDDGWPASSAVHEVCGSGHAGHPGTVSTHDDLAALLQAANRLDAEAISAQIDARFREASFETVVDEWLMPAMREVGRAWADGDLDVAGEHLISEVVRRRLGVSLELTRAWGTGPAVLLGLPPGAQHDLGLLAFAVALQRRSMHVIYLGSNVPLDSWVAAVQSRPVVGAVSVVARPSEAPVAASLVETLTTHGPESMVVGLGGGAQDLLSGTALLLGHHIGAGADLFAGAVIHDQPGDQSARRLS